VAAVGGNYPRLLMNAVEALERVHADAAGLAAAFSGAGYELYAVGGSVRDALMAAPPSSDEYDIDFTTNARPDEIARLMAPLCGPLWEQGRAFGTIGGKVRGQRYKAEITTFRSEAYVDHSRKPAVSFGDSLLVDLGRRDFTINAMALDVVTGAFHDPYGGVSDLTAKRLRTPHDPEVLFSDDPLRMLRAARFAARLHLDIDPLIESAATTLADRLSIVSPERIQGELNLLLLTEVPSEGLTFIVRTGLAEQFLPELPGLALEQDPVHRHKDVLAHTMAVVDKTSANLVLRLAALLHDIGKPRTRAITENGVTFHHHEVVGARMARKRMELLKYSQAMTDDVVALVDLHLRFHTYKMGWSDRAVRRYVRDAGDLLDELNELTRCDCTTRNARKATLLARRMDELEQRIAELREAEDLSRMRPALDGVAVMRILDIPPGRTVGEALAVLLEIRLDEGEIGEEAETARLRAWWTERSLS
jgi:poly(A) polymerase